MKLDAILDERDLNKRQFAMMADVPYTTVYEVISGKRSLERLTAINALRIAHALGMSVEELLDEEQPKLTADESELLELWRQMPSIGRRMVLGVARQIVQEADEDGED